MMGRTSIASGRGIAAIGVAWNVLLVVAGVGAIVLIGPKLVDQAGVLRGGGGRGWPGPAGWVMAEGVALLAAVLLMLCALGTWHARRAPMWARRVYAAAGLAFIAGAAWELASSWRVYGVMLWGDAAVFIGWYAVVTGPVVGFGVGWPGVAGRVWGRMRAG